ncbi:hypothetical protein HYC85_031038 [Camellia sinensis]|uniref:F-box associated beta-propeller type 3 domain-containing protein n=1 Tax=Camellia sinensis TaxID=4442 RepID=A0A7J7FPU4_CAMSI|nr:hypothetical protein HYC85_031038 [Camellia sinensis]
MSFLRTDILGFGLDPLTRDYKIIWILNFVERIGDESGDDIDYPYYVVALYTLGEKLWRHFDLLTIPTGHFIYNSLYATCINGAYYWLCFVGNDSQYGILSFDMRLEEFREIEVPANPEQKWGSLSLYNDSIGGRVLDQTRNSVKPFPEVLCPCEFWKKKELLFESRTNEVVLFNHETHEIRNLEMYGCGNALGLWVVCYKESLVSLFGQNDKYGRRGYQFSDAVVSLVTFLCFEN